MYKTFADEILYGSYADVQRALDRGEVVDIIDEYGYTPLIEAIIRNDAGILDLLLQQQPDLALRDMTGRSPLHWAVDYGNRGLIRQLLDAGADPNAYTIASQPVLVSPILRHQQFVKQLLMNQGADLNFAMDFINTKLLAHRYQLQAETDIVDHTGLMIPIDYEGFYLEFTVGIIMDSLARFKNNYGARHLRHWFRLLGPVLDAFHRADELIRYQHFAVNRERYRKRIHKLLSHQLLLIPVAYAGHAISFIKLGNLLARCDRGENSKHLGSVVIYEIGQPALANASFFANLMYTKQSKTFVEQQIHDYLALTPFTQLPLEAQKTGNCSWANIEASLPAMLFLQILMAHKRCNRSDLIDIKVQADSFYQAWLEWDRDIALHECVESFYDASAVRRAAKAALLASILVQHCDQHHSRDIRRAEKILSILGQPEYHYILQQFFKAAELTQHTHLMQNLRGIIDLCGYHIPLEEE